jgi:hypothetical protein
MRRQRLGDILVQAGVIRREQVDLALREQERWGGPLGQILVAKNFITEDLLVEALSSQLDIAIAQLGGVRIAKEVLSLVPPELANEHCIIPFRRDGSFLDLAMANPLNLGITDEIRIRTRLNVRPFIAGSGAITAALRLNYGTSIPMHIIGGDRRAGGAVQIREPALPVNPAEVTRLQERVSRLEGLLGRNEDIMRKLMRLLIDKDVASRDEILAAIR